METRPQPSAVRRWAALLVGIAAVWALVFVVAPLLQRFEPIGQAHERIRRSGIDAGALYYTDVEEFGDAETSVRNSIDYSPQPGRDNPSPR